MINQDHPPISPREAQAFLTAIGFEASAEDWRLPTEVADGMLALEADRAAKKIDSTHYQDDIRVLGRASLQAIRPACSSDYMVIG